MYKLLIIIIILLYLLYLLYIKENYVEKFNSYNDSYISNIQQRFDKFPLITSEDLILTNILNVDTVNTNNINLNKYNIKTDSNKLLISSSNNKINLTFDLSGNTNIINDQSNQQILNTFVKIIETKDLTLNKKILFPLQNKINLNQISVQNDISVNNTTVDNTTQNIANNTAGIRIWKQNMIRIACVEYNKNYQGYNTTCKTYKYGDIKLVDEAGVQYDTSGWVVIAVGHNFVHGNSDATGVFTYVYNKKWYGSCSNQGYIGTFMAIPLNYFESIDLNGFAGTYAGFPYT